MVYSITGLAYLALFISLFYLSFRLFQYWRKEKNTVSKLWFSFAALFSLFPLVKVVGIFFFGQSSTALERTIDIGGFIQALALAVAAYLVLYLRFQRISPWYGFFFVLFLGIVSAIFTVMVNFHPFLEPSSAVNWGYASGFSMLMVSVLRPFIYVITFIPLIIINFQQFRRAENSYAKGKALGLGLAFLILIFVAFIDFFIGRIFSQQAPLLRDVGYIVSGTVLTVSLMVSQASSKEEIKEFSVPK